MDNNVDANGCQGSTVGEFQSLNFSKTKLDTCLLSVRNLVSLPSISQFLSLFCFPVRLIDLEFSITESHTDRVESSRSARKDSKDIKRNPKKRLYGSCNMHKSSNVYSTLLPGRGCTGDGRRSSGADDVGERRHHDGELVLLVLVARRRNGNASSLLPDDLRLSMPMVVTSL